MKKPRTSNHHHHHQSRGLKLHAHGSGVSLERFANGKKRRSVGMENKATKSKWKKRGLGGREDERK